MIKGHGDDLYRYNGNITYNFSSNVYYRGCPPALLKIISSAVQEIQHYPSPAANELNKAAAEKFQLPANYFLFTNGATEAFYLVAQLFAGCLAAIVAPTFSEYEDACKIFGLNYRLVNLSSLVPGKFQLVFLCNPNNPDGRIIPTRELVQLVKEAPETTFVVDEAYLEFTDELTSLIPQVKELNNLVVVRSLTKTFTVPGIRLGYLVASPIVVQQLLQIKMPWSVNALAIRAGLALFENYGQWQFNVKELLAETRKFIDQLSSVKWLTVQPTHTSYFLVKLHNKSAAELKNYLAKEKGILIRDATNFNGLNGECIRLATQSPEANKALVNALQRWI